MTAGCLIERDRVPFRAPREDGGDVVLDLDGAEVLAHLDEERHPWDGVGERLLLRLQVAGVCEAGLVARDPTGDVARAFAVVALERDLEDWGGVLVPGGAPDQPAALLRALRFVRAVRKGEEARTIKEMGERARVRGRET